MTTARAACGRPIHFPGPLVLGPDGILAAPPRQLLEEIAAAVDHDALLIFASRLVKGASRRRFKPARAALNRCYLELAQLCINRALTGRAGMSYPDLPEAVALELLKEILGRDDQTKSNQPPAARIMDLYAQCLEAAQGHRETSGMLH